MNARLVSVCGILSIAGSAFGLVNQVGSITLFGQEYTIQRFDYGQEYTFPDPLDPAFPLTLTEAEAAHCLPGSGDGVVPTRLLLGSNEMFKQATYKDFIVEVVVDTDVDGNVSGLSFSRIVAVADPTGLPGAPGVIVNEFDFDIGGLTVNSGASGYAGGGNVLGTGTTFENTYGFDINSGALLETRILSNSGTCPDNLPCTDQFCGIEHQPYSQDSEDLCYIPSLNQIWILDQDDVISTDMAIVRFDADGCAIEPVSAGRIPVGPAMNPEAGFGEPKGMAFLADSTNFPEMFHGLGGVVLVAYTDEAGFHAIDLDGNEVEYEPMTVGGSVFGDDLLPMDDGVCVSRLEMEGIAADSSTGRIFIFNQGDLFECQFMFVLSPVAPAPLCVGDVNGDGRTNASDFNILAGSFGTAVPPNTGGDITGDGVVNALDFNLLSGDFGCDQN